MYRAPFLFMQRLVVPPHVLLLPLPDMFARLRRYARGGHYNWHRAAIWGNVLVSEQANVDCAAGFWCALRSAVPTMRLLPIGMHDYAESLGCCMLVDKTMFIADVLDCDASVVVCCRPEGFGKSMNLSMLKAFWSVQRSVALVSVCLPMLRFGMRTAGAIGMSMLAIR